MPPDELTRQRIDFAGVPEMVRTFLQVAAGAADIPVTRLLGQSPPVSRPQATTTPATTTT